MNSDFKLSLEQIITLCHKIFTTMERNKIMSEEKLKDVIRDEMDKVTQMLISGGSQNAIIITKWLQSLQRINDVCKERNRY